MHLEERLELKQSFLDSLETIGISQQNRHEKRLSHWVSVSFRMLHLAFLGSVLFLGFASMHHNIPRKYGWLALLLAIVWLLLERINLKHIDNLLLKKSRQKMINQLKKEASPFLAQIAQLEKYDMVYPDTLERVQEALTGRNYPKLDYEIEQIIYRLNATKSEDTITSRETNNMLPINNQNPKKVLQDYYGYKED